MSNQTVELGDRVKDRVTGPRREGQGFAGPF
jgi:hypothetical protein